MESAGLKSVIMTSMQALSGAGRSPGVVALDIMDNVIPYIPKRKKRSKWRRRKSSVNSILIL